MDMERMVDRAPDDLEVVVLVEYLLSFPSRHRVGDIVFLELGGRLRVVGSSGIGVLVDCVGRSFRTGRVFPHSMSETLYNAHSSAVSSSIRARFGSVGSNLRGRFLGSKSIGLGLSRPMAMVRIAGGRAT